MNVTTNPQDITQKEIDRLFQEYRGIVKTARDLFDIALIDPIVPEAEVRLLGRMILFGEDIDATAAFRTAAGSVTIK